MNEKRRKGHTQKRTHGLRDDDDDDDSRGFDTTTTTLTTTTTTHAAKNTNTTNNNNNAVFFDKVKRMKEKAKRPPRLGCRRCRGRPNSTSSTSLSEWFGGEQRWRTEDGVEHSSYGTKPGVVPVLKARPLALAALEDERRARTDGNVLDVLDDAQRIDEGR